MSKVVKKYIFSGFGFDIVLSNAILKTVDGEEYLDLDLNELKLSTAKALLQSEQSLTGHQLGFLRKLLGMSFEEVSKSIFVPASTLRLWEGRKSEGTGLSLEQERAFRIMAMSKILDSEKNRCTIKLALTKEFQKPVGIVPLEVSKG